MRIETSILFQQPLSPLSEFRLLLLRLVLEEGEEGGEGRKKQHFDCGDFGTCNSQSPAPSLNLTTSLGADGVGVQSADFLFSEADGRSPEDRKLLCIAKRSSSVSLALGLPLIMAE